MTWGEFKSAVRVHLGAHARRQMIQSYIDALIKSGVADLQRAVSGYRVGHRNVYRQSDLGVDGFCQTGALPRGQIVNVRVVKWDPVLLRLDESVYVSLPQVPMSDRQLMRVGTYPYASRALAVDPVNGVFAIVPSLNAESRLVVEWNGLKTDFLDADVTPFDESCAQCIADWVKISLSRDIEHDLQMSVAFDATHRRMKRALYSDDLERCRLADQEGRLANLTPASASVVYGQLAIADDPEAIRIFKGEDFDATIFLKIDDAPFNPTGSKVQFFVKSALGDPDSEALLLISSDFPADPGSDGPFPVVSAPAGTMRLFLDNPLTEVLPVEHAMDYEIRVTDALGNNFTAATGTFFVALR